jgi:hypothetical protein
MRHDDVGGMDCCVQLVTRHLGAGGDRQPGHVGGAGLVGGRDPVRHDRQQPVDQPAEVVRDRAERDHHLADLRRARAGEGAVAVEHRAHVLPAAVLPGAVLRPEPDPGHARDDAAGERGPAAARSALDVGGAQPPRTGQRQEGERDARAGADHVVEAARAEQPPRGDEVAGCVAPVAWGGVLDVHHVLALEEAAALGGVERDPGAALGHAGDPGGERVKLREVSPRGRDEERPGWGIARSLQGGSEGERAGPVGRLDDAHSETGTSEALVVKRRRVTCSLVKFWSKAGEL